MRDVGWDCRSDQPRVALKDFLKAGLMAGWKAAKWAMLMGRRRDEMKAWTSVGPRVVDWAARWGGREAALLAVGLVASLVGQMVEHWVLRSTDLSADLVVLLAGLSAPAISNLG